MAAIINTVRVNKKLVSVAKSPKYIPFYRNAVSARFVVAKNDMIKDFSEHEITKELLQDPSVAGSALVSKGNLVSFLGLEDGSLEVGKIRASLEVNTQLGEVSKTKIRESQQKIYFDFPVYYPSKEELDDLTPSPWSSRSIIELIENGVGNAMYFVFRSLGLPGSRSGFGLQRESPTKRGGNFIPKKWITEILNNFKKKFKSYGG